MAKKANIIVAVVLGFVSLTGLASADDPKELFQQVYGEEAQVAEKSENQETCALLASKLLNDAKSLRDDPSFANFILEKAVHFGDKGINGYPFAEEALTLLVKRVPAKAQEWQARLLAIHTLWYEKAVDDEKTKIAERLIRDLVEAGDRLVADDKPSDAVGVFHQAAKVAAASKSPHAGSIGDRIRATKEQIEVGKKIADYQAKLKTDPKDAATAKALVLLYVCRLNSPELALPFLKATGDDQLKKYVPLMAQDTMSLTESSVLELAEGCRKLSANFAPERSALLQQSAMLYARFLDMHPRQDGVVLVAKKGLEDIKKELGNQFVDPVPVLARTDIPVGSAVWLGKTERDDGNGAGGAHNQKNAPCIIYLVHCSGQMTADFDSVVKAIKQSLGSLTDANKFSIIYFKRDGFEEGPPKGLSPATEENKAMALNFLGRIEASGFGSSPIPAMTAAFNAFRNAPNHGGRVLYLITTGDFQTSAYKYKGLDGNDAVNAWLRDNNAAKTVHVYPLIFGGNPGDNIRTLAAENGGKCWSWKPNP
ncbi:MAG: hypothetical protein NTV86_04175 [Planctomycetota bacterium]|nr:hypothetical protein [Planctomycetota bacterium]